MIKRWRGSHSEIIHQENSLKMTVDRIQTIPCWGKKITRESSDGKGLKKRLGDRAKYACIGFSLDRRKSWGETNSDCREEEGTEERGG